MAIAIAAIACKPEEKIIPTVTVNSTSETLVIPSEGNEAAPISIAFNSNVEWTASLDAASTDWATISPVSGAAGDAVVRLIALENKTTDNRVATITIMAQTAKAEVKVTQLQKDALVLEGEKEFTIGMDGGEVKFAVNANVSLTATPEVDWISATKAMTTTEFSFAVAPNTGEAREGKIVVTDGTLKETVLVKQDAWMPIFEVAPAEEQWIALEGGSVEITVTANVEYAVTVADNDWLTVTNDGNVYKLTAGANSSFDYRSVAVTVAPKDEAFAESAVSFYVFQNGRATKLWTLNTAADIADFDRKAKVRLAKYGDFILLGNTTKAFVINPADGSLVTAYPFPDGVAAGSLCVDDAGNIVLATDCSYGGTMGIYSIADPANPQPELIKDFNTGNYYGNDVGNLRIKGDIKKNAMMTALISDGAGGACLMWEFADGVCSTWYYSNPPYAVVSSSWGCVAPVGTDFESGLYHVGYNGDYNFNYVANPGLDSGANVWSVAYATGGSWMENWNCISTVEHNGKKYAAIMASCFFSYDDPEVHILDVTDPANATLVYKYSASYDVVRDESWVNTQFTEGGDTSTSFSDVLLYSAGDALVMVYIDANYGSMACVEIK